MPTRARGECVVHSVNGLYGTIHRSTLMHVDLRRRKSPYRPSTCGMHRRIRRRTQGWHKQCKVQNMPLIWCMSYHATNSSHVTDHFLSTFLSLCYMLCVPLEIAVNASSVLCWKAQSWGAVRGDRTPPAAAPCVRPGYARHVGPFYGASVYSCSLWQPTVLSYGEALADRIVSYRIVSLSRYFVWYRIVSIVFSWLIDWLIFNEHITNVYALITK